MFGREFTGGRHRQHVMPPTPTRYSLERVGHASLKIAESYQLGGGWSARVFYDNDDGGEYAEAILTGPGGAEETIYPGDGRRFEPGEVQEEARQIIDEYGDDPYSDTYQYNSRRKRALSFSGLSVGDEVYWYDGGDDVDTSASGVIVEIPAVDPDGRTRSDMAAVEWADEGYEIVEIDNLLNAEHYNIGRGYSQAFGARKQASSLTWEHETAEQSMLGEEIWFAYSGDGFQASVTEESPGSGRFTADIYTDSDLYKHLSTTEYGFESVDEAKSFVEGVFGYSRVSSRTASIKTAAVTWYDQSDQFGGMWSTYQGSAPDSPNGQISESHGTYRWYVSDSGTRGNQQTGESSSLEEAKREAESVLASLGITASRTASHRTAFLDTVELTEPRHRVAGWDWDDHLNGFLAAEAAREFTCSCGANVPAPGYTDCRCGKRWNCYQVQANGSVKLIAREIPVRDGVIMASRAVEEQVSLYHDGMDDDT